MKSHMLKRAAFAAITPALLLQFTPAQAAAPVAVKPKPPVLSCTTATAEGLSYTVIKPGNDDRPNAESKVTVNYKGMLSADGTEFDSGQAAQFSVGGVIPGFAQGLQLMQVGGSYRLCIPAALGYGAAGTGPIPANADLVFEVDLLSFTNPPPKPVIPVAERSCSQSTATGLGFEIVKSAAGKKPVDGDMALVDFTIFDANTGIVQQKSEWEKIPLRQASPIFRESLNMMSAGSTYRFCMPKTQDGTQSSNIIVTLIDLRPAPAADN
ncbi:FKBP-type peptidyl-prolyl cis-trans isomerase [Sphingorhabdus wooponensis]|jgi:FKBP-type peptidyl-prolyl cis-trans isomerase FkpA|nr:FKBP-type peptidyl-prolyl cis-trans isomerase [Sphingorhabdus wooponensis]